MTTFDLILEDRGLPGWVTALIFVGFLLLTVLSFFAASKFNETSIGTAIFGMLGTLCMVLTIGSFGIVDTVNQSIQADQVREQLTDRGYDNIDLEGGYSDTFVASKDGLYVEGDLLEKSYTELVVVIREP